MAGVDRWLFYTVEPLYKRIPNLVAGVDRWLFYTVEPLYKGHLNLWLV